MNFVESLSMFHVDAKEIPCVTEKGAPTEKTQGAPGVLYMDTDTGDLYKCRAADAVNGVYTWEKIGGGNSEYKLPIAGEQLGGVKNGGNVVINPDGTMTAPVSDSSPNGSMSDNATALLITILRNAQYISDQSANITALEEALAGSGGEVAPSVYTVKNTLTNVSTNNAAESIAGGESYTATLTADDGHVIDYIRVIMGGKDITDTAYSDGVITIETVTGNLEITAVASYIASTDIMQIGSALHITGGVTVTHTDNVLHIA